jgi:aspartokinase/homoserine dehydrogenase 1
MGTEESNFHNNSKKINVIDNVALIDLLGHDFLGKVGIDLRIFRALAKKEISVSFVVQGSFEKGIGLVVSADNADKASAALYEEFDEELNRNEVYQIVVDKEIAVVSVTGENWKTFYNSLNALIKNNITPILINNTTSGDNVTLVLKKNEAIRASKVIYSEIFGESKKINIAIFGHGRIGGTLINQILDSKENIEKKKHIKLNIFAVANSRKIIFDRDGVGRDWNEQLKINGLSYTIDDVIHFARRNHLENLIAIDNTADKDFVRNYIRLIENSFDMISSNKVANTLSYGFFQEIRQALKTHKKRYLYETNVGAGLPLIDTIGLLHLSGENITRIRGVFSGSLSYIFNNYSIQDKLFSDILKEAMELGLTEPDPREDLCGNDVARKLLILARELDLQNEITEVAVQNLIPNELRPLSTTEFLKNLNMLNNHYQKIKKSQQDGFVLRYVGELSGDLQQDKGCLEVKMISVSSNSVLGQLRGSDSIFEIYTESYGSQPIVIQGAGAGAKVTARGVFGDILRLT